MKRVVGIPGDRVAMRGGVLVINGTAVPRRPEGAIRLDDGVGAVMAKLYAETMPGGPTYVVAKITDEGLLDNLPETVVPPGMLFMMGDNRDNSADSRQRNGALAGPVPAANVVGRPLTVFWSRDRARFFRAVQERFTSR